MILLRCSRKMMRIIGIVFLFITLSSVGAAHAQKAGSATYQDRKEDKKINEYIKKYATDVIELKDGGKIIGKVTGEATGVVFYKNISNGEEGFVNRNKIRKIRQLTTEELQDMKNGISMQQIAQEEERIIQEKQAELERKQAEKMARIEEENMVKMSRAVQQKKRSRSIESGMSKSDVEYRLGQPVNKRTYKSGELDVEEWDYSRGRTVVFVNDEVE